MSVNYFDIKIDGLKELERELSSLTDKVRRRAMTRGVAQAATLTKQFARAKARELGLEDTGALIKALRMKRKRSRGRDVVLYGIGYSGPGWYGRLYEYGFKNPVGSRVHRPVLRTVMDQRGEEIAYAIKGRIWDQIVKIQKGGIARPK